MIIASAVMTEKGFFVGKRHGDAMLKAIDILGELPDIVDDGFITSDLKFLNRFEAFLYAKESNQFKRYELWYKSHPDRDLYTGYDGEQLFSEDLW
jgi:hypothetical protein